MENVNASIYEPSYVLTVKNPDNFRISNIGKATDLLFSEKFKSLVKVSGCKNHGTGKDCNYNIFCVASDTCPSDFTEISLRKTYGTKVKVSSENSNGAMATPKKVKEFQRNLSDKDGSDYSDEEEEYFDSSKKEERSKSQKGTNKKGPIIRYRSGRKGVSEKSGEDVKAEMEEANVTQEPQQKKIGEWHLERENSFMVGDRLEVDCLSWEKDGYCWIRLKENYQTYKKITKFLKENQENFPDTKPLPNDLFVVKHDGSWYRGKVVGVNPTLIIRCIDTGVTLSGMELSRMDLKCKQLDPELAALDSLAFRAVVSKNTKPEKLLCGPMKVKITGIKTRMIYEITLLSGIKTLPAESSRSKFLKKVKSSRRNVFDDLKEGMCGVFVSSNVQNSEMLGMLVPDDIEDAVTSFRHVKSLCCLDGQEIEANVEDFVMVLDRKKSGRRGVVKSKSSEYGYEVALVDMGFAVYTKKIYGMPRMALHLMDLACKIKITTEIPRPFKLVPDSKYYFEVMEEFCEGKWLCSLKKNFEAEEYLCNCILERVDESLHKVRHIPFGRNSIVVISSFADDNSDNTIYIRRADEYYQKKLDEMREIMDKLPENNDLSFRKAISPGDLVAAKYKDGHCYRASIIHTNQKNICAFLVDYGYRVFVKVNQVKPLPHSLIKKPLYARKVTLIGINDSLNMKGYKYLENLMTTSRKLILQYNNDINNGVILVEKEAYDINPHVFDHELSEQSKYLDKFTERYFGEFSFSPGFVENLQILYIDPDEFEEMGVFWAANPNINYNTESLKKVIEEIEVHCKSAVEYAPEGAELCFALFEDKWHRAFAIEAHGKDFEIFLIDVGRTVFLQPRSIRKMELKFFALPPLAMKCVLEDFETFEKEFETAYDYLVDKVNQSVEDAEIVAMNDVGSVIRMHQLQNM